MSTEVLRNHGRKGTLRCSLHGTVTSVIDEGEVPACCHRHRDAGCLLGLVWKSTVETGYRG